MPERIRGRAEAGISRDDEEALFRVYAATGSRDVRNRLVELHMGLATHIARRYQRPSVEADDLRQVAMVGLVRAVERFDPGYGSSFVAFAGQTIEGELKRYFRDKSWVVRVPRSAKDLHLRVRRAVDELTANDGRRRPSVAEIAAHLGLERDDVHRGLAAGAAYTVGSLDAAIQDGLDGSAGPAVSQDDVEIDRSIDRRIVAELIERLPERERQIVWLRFYEGMSQNQIAELVGLSQMHVSRLLRASFSRMRTAYDAARTSRSDGRDAAP